MPWPRWLTRRTRRRLALALAAAFVLPWTIGQWARVGLQPGLADDVERRQMLIDFMVAGGIVCALSMVATYAVGCWIVAVMQGPARRGDPFPATKETQRDSR